ncbi:glycosyltransferase family 4 protein [Candidatus Azambacteria bacterium]|nr:glycosyltransferase family 4 protein [Candidatus Azambacteria bacterium]
MNVCFIGKHIYPKDIFSNEQDLKTWRSLSAYFGRLFVIAQSPDIFFHRGEEKNIAIYLLPRLGYPCFITSAAILGFYFNLKNKIDVFDASEVIGGGMAVAILKFFTGVKAVVEIQGEIFRKNEKEKLKNRLLKKIGRFVMRKADRVRVISRAIFDQVKSRGIPENKIRLVSLRVDLKLFNPDSWVSETYKKEDEAVITLGYIGRLVDGKGLEDLLAAISRLHQDYGGQENFKALIFGNGPLRPRLEKIADKLKINDKIEWRGFAPYGKVPAALAQIDIFIYPSWHEGFGRSIMEALAMEKAVVATRVGGIPDLVKDGENGFLVEPHNPEMLAGKIKELIENKGLREKFGKAGREWISKNFEWNDGIKKFANLFLELKK